MTELKSSIQRDLEGVDDLVHEPRRFAILNMLSGDLESVDYRYIQGVLGLTSGNLSRHLAKLEEGGLIEVLKEFVLKRPRTRVRLTKAGRTAVERHWELLQKLRDDAMRARDDG